MADIQWSRSKLAADVPSSASPTKSPKKVDVKDKSELGPPKSVTANIQDMLVGAALKGATASMLTTKDAKAPLSILTTSVNFRKFVQKAGPVFRAQDEVESVLRWENPSKTIFGAAIWAAVCYNPVLAIVLPQLGLIAALVATHNRHKRPPLAPGNEVLLEAHMPSPTLTNVAVPVEGSIDYLANLQNIQGMMGRISDLTDAGRMAMPVFDWSLPRRTLLLLNVLAILAPLTLLAVPTLPIRFIAFVGGETAIFMAHPYAQAIIGRAIARASMSFLDQFTSFLAAWMSTDSLPDEVLDIPHFKIQLALLVEHERKTAGEQAYWIPDDLGSPWTDEQGNAAEPASHLPPPDGCDWLEQDVWVAGPWRRNGVTRSRRWTRRAVRRT